MVGGCTRLSCFGTPPSGDGVLGICGHTSQSPLEVGLLATINRTPVEEGYLCCLVDLVNHDQMSSTHLLSGTGAWIV